ncbi:MAG: hypothetical protein RR891_03205 [Clostridium sp.]|uniref:hypothetical protein n=1 Tax=Clostridium sp. TaxID=1506 RepID=UPI00305E0B35
MRSWSEQIRFFYATTFVMLTSMIWTIASSVVFNVEISFYLFIITLISALVARYLFKKEKRLTICILVPIVPLIIYEIIKGITFLGCLDVIFVIFIIIKLINEENENINYDRYKRVFVQGSYILFMVSMVYALTLKPSISIIYRGSIIYLVLIILTLRESMGYCYNVKRSKESRRFNIVLIIFSTLITQDFFYNKCIAMLEAIYGVINFIADKLLSWILVVVGYLIVLAINAIQSLFKGNGSFGEGIMFEPGKTNIDVSGINVGDQVNPIVTLVIKGAIILTLLVLVIRIGRRIVRNKKLDNEMSYTEIVEFIEVDKKPVNEIFKMIKKIFRKKGSPREEVIYKYGEFVGLARKKGIFEKYMTPKQLANVTKIKIDYCEGLDEIANIYNEAKFSKHSINSNKEETVGKNVDNISKKMK